MSDVFISYSRRDELFVRRLHTVISERGQEVWVDWEDIPLTADWWLEIQAGIEAANTFIFVISPDSAQSEVCYNEVDHAHRNNKRLVPVMLRTLSREEQQKLHPAINRHNWVFFTDENQFENNINRLVAALETDLSYVRDHTRLLVRAKEWDRRGRNSSFLLRGDDLANAEAFLVESTRYTTPKPTNLQTEYIFASRRLANRLQRLTLGSVLFGLLVALMLAGAAFLNFRQAESNLLLSRQTQSLFLADLSRQQLSGERFRLAQLLALEAVAHYPAVNNGESSRALLNALTIPPQKLITLRHDEGLINGVRLSKDETQLLSAAGDEALIWAINSGDVVLRLQHEDVVRGGLWNGDESRLLTWSDDRTARVWDPFIDNELLRLVHDGPVGGAFWALDGTYIVTWADDGTVRLWDANTGIEAARYSYGEPVRGVSLHMATGQLLIWYGNRIVVQAVRLDADSEPLVLVHGDRVNGALWNAAGTHILSWSRDGSVRRWSLNPDEPAEVFWYTGQVTGAVWSAAEDRIIAWGRVRTAQVWLTEGEGQTCQLEHEGNVQGAVWDTAGERLLTWATDGRVRLWKQPCAGDAQDIGVYTRAVEGAMWNSSEDQVVSWSADNRLQVWDAAEERLAFEFTHDAPVTHVLLGQDDRRVISVALDNTVQVWTTDPVTVQQQDVVIDMPHSQRVLGALWNSDESRVLSWAADGTARLWDMQAASERLLATFQHGRAVNTAAWNADESRLFTAGQDGMIGLWNTDGNSVARIEFTDDATGAVWDSAGQRLLAWSRDGMAGIWTSDGQLLASMPHDAAVNGALWSHDETQVLTWTASGQVYLWAAVDGTRLLGPWRHSGAIQGAQWNAAGDRFLIWSDDGTVRVWRKDNQLLPLLLLRYSAPVAGAQWDATETYILTWTRDPRDNQVTIWSAQRSQRLAQLPHGSSSFGVQGAVWNADGTRVLSWSSNGVIRVWDIAQQLGLNNDDNNRLVSASPLLTLRHNRFINGARWNADETRILSWSTDDTARIWNMDGEELFVFNQGESVSGALWNAEETRVLTWNTGGLVKQWVVDVPAMIEIGRQRAVEPLSATERRMFFLTADSSR